MPDFAKRCIICNDRLDGAPYPSRMFCVTNKVALVFRPRVRVFCREHFRDVRNQCTSSGEFINIVLQSVHDLRNDGHRVISGRIIVINGGDKVVVIRSTDDNKV